MSELGRAGSRRWLPDSSGGERKMERTIGITEREVGEEQCELSKEKKVGADFIRR